MTTSSERYNELDWLDKGNGLQPYVRQYADTSDSRPVETLWTYEEAGSTHESQEELKALILSLSGATPKPTKLIKKIIAAASEDGSWIFDCFGGSGTTGHAAIDYTREGESELRYLLIEMGEHFDTVLVPRLKKVIYSKDWKEGKPVNRTTGISHCFKVLRLESYEDTLNNLRLTRSAAHEGALKLMDADQQDEYRLGYMLDVEAEGSASLLNVSAFTIPGTTRWTSPAAAPGRRGPRRWTWWRLTTGSSASP